MKTRNAAPDPGDPEESWWVKALRRLCSNESFEEAEFEQAKQIAARTNSDLSKVLVQLGMVGERELLQAKAQEMGYGFADLERIQLDPVAVESLSAAVARSFHILPVRRHGQNLWVAIDEPGRLEALDAVKTATGCRVIPVLALPGALETALRNAYPSVTL